MEYLPFFRFTTNNAQMAIAVSAIMFLGGLVFLLYGWRVYRVLLVIACALTAGYLGWYFLHPRLPEGIAFLVPLLIGLLGGFAAIPIQRVVVFLVAGTAGFLSLGPVVAELVWRAPEGPTPTHYLLCGAGAFVIMGFLGLILFKPVMVIATSMFGATLLLSAAVHVAETFPEHRTSIYAKYPNEMAWIYAGVTIVGVLFQLAVLRKQKKSD